MNRIKRILLPLAVGWLLMPSIVFAGDISHERYETAAHAYYAALPDGYRLTEREKIEVLRLAGWDEEVIPEALQIIDCESWHGVVDAVGDNGLALGLFQVHWLFWAEWADYQGNPFNPIENASLALRIYERDAELYNGDAWRQWTCRHFMHNF